MNARRHGQIITSAFKPAWWATNRHIQTIWPRFLQRRQQVQLDTERLELPDGDFVDLSWTPKPTICRGIAVLFHGLEGSAHSHYAKDMLAVLAKQGWHCVLMHFRGCSATPNRLPRAYHSGDTADAAFMLTGLQQRFPTLNKVAVGFSLGANMLLKLLGEYPKQTWLQAAVCVSPPFRLNECANAVNHGFSRNYQKYLLKSMIRKLRDKMTHLDYRNWLKINASELYKLTSFRLFDEHVTSKLHGFKDADDYYQQCSAAGFSRLIQTPTLILHSKDDPFMNDRVIPTIDELSPAVTLELSKNGGHVGFMQGTPWKPTVWLHQRIPQFFSQQGFD